MLHTTTTHMGGGFSNEVAALAAGVSKEQVNEWKAAQEPGAGVACEDHNPDN